MTASTLAAAAASTGDAASSASAPELPAPGVPPSGGVAFNLVPWIGFVVLAATTYLAALNLALIHASESSLERRLVAGGRAAASQWLLPRLSFVAQGVALLRTLGRVGFAAVVVAEIVGMGEVVRVTPTGLLTSVLVASALLWLFTSVLASAIADHAGTALIARSVALLRAVYVLTLPLNRVVGVVDEAVRRLTGANARAEDVEEELLRSIEDTQRQGGLNAEAATLLENVVEFTGTDVSAVMTPRIEIEGLEYTDDLGAIRAVIAEGGHSRIPVYRGSLDEIVGILYVKDLVRYLGAGVDDFRLQPILRQPIRVPETKPVSELLKDFQRSEVHMAIVIDEYGGTSGLVTIEDVLEEIVGEIRDEHEPHDEQEPDLRRLDERTVEIDGRYRIDDLNAELGLALPEEDAFDTVAGLLLARFGRVPSPGEAAEFPGATFTILDATPTQIIKLRAELASVPAGM
ncbi:MAG TPA: hemolysin family protein [Phycisphaerales bacterium]|nr:hemolysin family protein [Phycisphaerales bacterium]HMP37586.1 hemolysin family protein [Phycisphaerales bacterium]